MPPLMPFVAQLDVILSRDVAGDAARCRIIARRLTTLLTPDWLPAEATAHGTESYGRHLLYEDAAGRYSIGSFVWWPGEATPIHDHHCWGVVGVAQGRLVSQDFQASTDGRNSLRHAASVIIPCGQTIWLSPGSGDIHRLVNPSPTTAISIHVYGAAFSAICRTRYDDPAQTEAPILFAVARNRF